MNRRQAALAVVISTVAAMTNNIHAQQSVTGSIKFRDSPLRTTLVFDLNTFTQYQLVCGERSLTLTPEQMMDALMGDKR